MSKQDRVAPRTAADIDLKYNFRQTFAEFAGLVEESKKAAEEAQKAVDNLDDTLNQEEIFNRLTDDGKVQGIYRDDDGQVYINASYLVTGVLRSKDGSTFYLDLDNGVLKGKFEELSIGGKTVEEIAQSNLDTFAEEVTKDIADLQNQIDGNITSWFYDYVPSTYNEPASAWTTDELKNQHLGDLFYITGNDEHGGMCYRWVLIDGEYSWQLIEDTEVTKALAAAAAAQDTADSKRRVFVVQPVPPYDVGDLWAQGGDGDLMRCKNARASGSYAASDWELASKYIDATTAGNIAQEKTNALDRLLDQTGVFNRLTKNGAAQGLFIDNGDVYINASYIKTGILLANLIQAGVLQSKDGKTFYLDLDNGVLKGAFTELSISGKTVDTIAQEKANTAQSNAVSHANSVASTAESSAKSYASSVAGTAESNAKSYASSVAGTAESNAKAYANQAAANAVNAQTQLDIFNKLTNNGALPGLFMKNGQLYINASYMSLGTLDANLVKIVNLIAERLTSKSGDSTLKIDGAHLRFLAGSNETARLSNDYSTATDGKPILYMKDIVSGAMTSLCELSPHHLKLGGTSANPLFHVATGDGYSRMNVDAINQGKTTLYSGSCAVGGSCTVPHTARYDLFAVFLGDGSTMQETAVLCYKHGSSIRGVGGRANTLDKYKEIHFFEATISGNTWTIVDCGYNNAYASGGFSDSYRLKLMKVVGVI